MIEYKKRYCIEFEINQIPLNDDRRQEQIDQIYKDYYLADEKFIHNMYYEYKGYEEEDKKCKEVK